MTSKNYFKLSRRPNVGVWLREYQQLPELQTICKQTRLADLRKTGVKQTQDGQEICIMAQSMPKYAPFMFNPNQ